MRKHHYKAYVEDHLGNVRSVVTDDGGCVQSTQYYPFGGIMGDLSTGPDVQHHKYNGKEYDHIHGLDWYDYGARSYDPALATWTSVGPLAEKYPSISPYVYCMNNPVNAIDVDGDSIQTNQVALMDKTYGTDYNGKINSDLSFITGLHLSNSDSGQLLYEKDENGKAIIEKHGENIVGSEKAREMLIKAIDSKETIRVFLCLRGVSQTPNNELQVGLSAVQIQGFIDNTSRSLDNRTMGFGMVLLHEMLHSKLGNGLHDSMENFTTGDVVDQMNIIRKELGNNFGQRLSYPAILLDSDNNAYLPFDRASYNSLEEGLRPHKNNKYISIPNQ